MPWFVVVALLVVSFVLTSLMVKNQKQKPASLEEFDFPQSDEGTPEAVIFGDVWQKGPFVPWYGDLETIKIKQSKK